MLSVQNNLLMEKNIEQLLRERRSRYALEPCTEEAMDSVERFICETLNHVPSAFNSQSTRMVLLRDGAHKRFWDAVCRRISEVTSPEAYEKSRRKIERSFASGSGTVLFYEDGDVVDRLKEEYPLYAAAFPAYSQHTSAMHQIVMWLLLTGEGLGASLQHYEALVAEDVRLMFGLPASWHLIAQMPFGIATDTPGEKSLMPMDERFFTFRR